MKGRYIQLHAGKKSPAYMFDRYKLIDGYTNDGRHVPDGGVVLNNGNLAGYVPTQSGGNGNDKMWTVIGKIDYNDPNSQHIPPHQSNVKPLKITNPTKTSQIGKGRRGANMVNERPVSLKTAVKMLRQYYRNDFN